MNYAIYNLLLNGATRADFVQLDDRMNYHECLKLVDEKPQGTDKIVRAYSYLGAAVVLTWNLGSFNVRVVSPDNRKNARICNGLEKLAVKFNPDIEPVRSKTSEKIYDVDKPLSDL